MALKGINLFFIVILAFILSSCMRNQVKVTKLFISQKTLASHFARTPDPSSNPPPKGEQLLTSWAFDAEQASKNMRLQIDMLYNNLEKETQIIPLTSLRGSYSVFLTGDKFLETKGFLSYRALVLDEKDQVLASWKQRMWFDLLKIQDEDS